MNELEFNKILDFFYDKSLNFARKYTAKYVFRSYKKGMENLVISTKNRITSNLKKYSNIPTKYYIVKEYFMNEKLFGDEKEKYLSKGKELLAIVLRMDLEALYAVDKNIDINPLFEIMKEKNTMYQGFFEYYMFHYLPEKLYNTISALIPKKEMDYYPEARFERHFYIHVGGTNTGKTYSSIQALTKASNGVYLAPLRLLAMEVQDTLLKKGIVCSLRTGEEAEIINNSTVISSTVEMLDVDKNYDIAVVDECQFISDDQRGHSWMRAILGLKSKEIYLCAAPNAVKLLVKIIESCGDSYEIINHERKVPLVFDDNDVSVPVQEEGVAYIFFSKKKVLAFAGWLKDEYNITSSVIYGDLPYQSRKKQVEMFVNGINKCVVSTDAIGMGLNLPIKRIVFMDSKKFDGEEIRYLEENEVKQIAGRAGRYGIYDKGYVSCVSDKKRVKKLLIDSPDDLIEAYVGFPDILVGLDFKLDQILTTWIKFKGEYNKMSIVRLLSLIKNLENNGCEVQDNQLLYDLITVCFNEREELLLDYWINMSKQWVLKGVVIKPDLSGVQSKKSLTILQQYELMFKMVDLYYAFCQKMKVKEEQDVICQKKELAEKISLELKNNISSYVKKCRVCGKTLAWDYKYNLCQNCFKRHSQY